MSEQHRQGGRVPMGGEELRRYFRMFFLGEHEVTPRAGDHLTVETEAGLQSVRVEEVTSLSAAQHGNGVHTDRFSVVLEGDLEVVLHDDSYDFAAGATHFPMDIRRLPHSNGGSLRYEALLEIDISGKI